MMGGRIDSLRSGPLIWKTSHTTILSDVLLMLVNDLAALSHSMCGRDRLSGSILLYHELRSRTVATGSLARSDNTSCFGTTLLAAVTKQGSQPSADPGRSLSGPHSSHCQ
jgi:hypothetical protein